MLREEHLTTTRQIVVASRDLGQTDPRFVFARHHWRTDNHLAALGLIEGGPGLGLAAARPGAARTGGRHAGGDAV